MTEAASRLTRIRAGYGSLLRIQGVDRVLLIGTAGTIVLNVAQTLVNFAITLSLSHLLGARGFGAYAYAFAWSSLCAVPSVLGLTPLVVRNVAAYREQARWGLLRGMIRRANLAVVLSSAAILVVGSAVAFLVNGSRHELLYPVLVGLLLVPIIALTSIRQAAMQGLGRVVLGRVPETLVAPVLFLALVAGSQVAGRGAASATWIMALQVVAWTAALLLGAVLLRRALPQHAKTEEPEHAMREWIRSALPLLLFSGIQALNAQIDVILLGAITGSSEAGVFAVAARVAGLISFVMLAASYPFAPAIARLHASGNTVLLRRTVRRAAIGIFVVSLPVAVGVIAFAGPLLGVFGAEFKGGVTAVVVLSVAQVGFVATGFAGSVLVMTGYEALLARGVAFGAATSIVANVVLIPLYGLNGAAVASLIGFTVTNASLAYLARRRGGVPSTAFGI